jgi:YHS domain-containing protein
VKKILLLILATGVVAPLVFAETAVARPVYVASQNEGVAVNGFDTVSYFRGNGTPVKGNAAFTVRYDGADYHFANAENAEAFKADPAAFAPQYGGHCSWAMARGYLAPGDPKQYRVVDGKLYLNFNAEVRAKWLKDIAGFIKQGDVNWPTFPDDAKFGA